MAKELLTKSAYISLDGGTNNLIKLTGWSLEVNKETVDLTSIDSPSAWKEFAVDLKEWSLSFDGIVVREDATTLKDYQGLLESLIDSDTAVSVFINETGSTAYSTLTLAGSGFLTGVPLSGSLGDKQTYSGTVQGSGALTAVATP
jgi:predicted secreted protein